jgi:hypothetical protein
MTRRDRAALRTFWGGPRFAADASQVHKRKRLWSILLAFTIGICLATIVIGKPDIDLKNRLTGRDIGVRFFPDSPDHGVHCAREKFGPQVGAESIVYRSGHPIESCIDRIRGIKPRYKPVILYGDGYVHSHAESAFSRIINFDESAFGVGLKEAYRHSIDTYIRPVYGVIGVLPGSDKLPGLDSQPRCQSCIDEDQNGSDYLYDKPLVFAGVFVCFCGITLFSVFYRNLYFNLTRT